MFGKILRLVHNYNTNRKMIEAVASKVQTPVVFVWQPIPSYQYNQDFHLFAQMQTGRDVLSNNACNLIQDLAARGEMGRNFIFCGDMQVNKREPLYVDAVHYTAKMSREFAELIVSEMAGRNLIPEGPNRPEPDSVEKMLKAGPIEDMSFFKS